MDINKKMLKLHNIVFPYIDAADGKNPFIGFRNAYNDKKITAIEYKLLKSVFIKYIILRNCDLSSLEATKIIMADNKKVDPIKYKEEIN